MSITKSFINKFLSLMLVLSVVLAGLLPSTAVYASEVNTPGSKSSSSVTLTTEGLLLSVTVPTSVLIYVDEQGEVTTPDYLQITNHSIAPVYAHTLEVTPFNGWTLDPPGTSYKGTKLNNNKHYWLSFNGLDPSDGPINLSTLISGHSSLNLDLLADVAPQREAIHAFNIGEIIVTVGWDINEDVQEPVIPPETGGFTVGDVYHEYVDGYGDFVFIPLLTGGVGDYRVIIVAEGGDPETQALTDEVREKKSEGSTTVGVPLPGYNPALAYEVYVTCVDDDESETIVKVLSPKEVDPDIDFEVHSVDHGGEGIVEFYMTVEAPCMVEFAMVPAGSQPPQKGTRSFSLDYAGTQTRGVEIYGGYDDSIDYDIYVWVYDAEWNPVGPVKVLLAAYGSETGDDDSGDDGTGPNGEFIPEGYTLATDADFSGTRDGDFRYIGSKPYVVVPHVIKGVPVTSYYYMFGGTDVKGVASDNPNITDMSRMFESSTSETLDLTYLDTSNVVNMSNMFSYTSAKNLDLSGFDTSNVTDMSGMFYGYSDTTLDLSGFDTSNVTDMSWMFAYSYYSPDFTNLDTSNVTNMAGMFEGNYSTTLNLTGLDTSSVTDMSNMFKGGRATSYDFSNFDTSNVTNMSSMFDDNDATTLDLSNFDTSSLTNMSSMFRYSSATTVDISSFNLAEIQPSISDIFDYADNLTTVYVRAQEDIDYIIERSYSEIPDTINFVIK